MIIFFIFWLFVVLFLVYLTLQLLYLWQGPPFVESDDKSIEHIITFVNLYKPKRIIDIGSGNGKLVIALARKGYYVDGIEINPILSKKSQISIKRAGLKNARIFWGNFWSFDVSDYDMVVLYLINHVMPKMQKKLEKELSQ